MRQSLFFTLGSFLVGTALGWTYHYSNSTMNWKAARQWCQSNYTDMVVIQNQDENDYVVSILPNRTKSPYYWIGITKTHKKDPWTWIGNNSTWVGDHSWAKNEPNNNDNTEFCVEIYVNVGINRGRWNDEKCSHLKYAVCYKAQCNATSCERGRCWETIDNTTCLCDPGFVGDRCHIAVNDEQTEKPEIKAENTTYSQNTSSLWSSSEAKDLECPPLSVPDNGHLLCYGGNNTLNSTCRFHCHPGFLMIGSATVSCAVTGVWSGPRPVCANYKQALMAIGVCSIISTVCCICLCWMKRRKRKKLAQVRHLEDGPSSEAQG